MFSPKNVRRRSRDSANESRWSLDQRSCSRRSDVSINRLQSAVFSTSVMSTAFTSASKKPRNHRRHSWRVQRNTEKLFRVEPPFLWESSSPVWDRFNSWSTGWSGPLTVHQSVRTVVYKALITLKVLIFFFYISAYLSIFILFTIV